MWKTVQSCDIFIKDSLPVTTVYAIKLTSNSTVEYMLQKNKTKTKKTPTEFFRVLNKFVWYSFR